MATLKYKDEHGNYQPIVGLNVQNEVVQTTGTSTTAVMSLKAVSDLVPSQASSSNQLADKAFVNSSVSTATATYRGCYNLVSDLSLTIQASHGLIETALGTVVSGTPDNNDYAFVQIPTADATPTEIASVERYKFNGTLWSFEYTLNNSGFTAAQWAAVNSNITSGLVAKINALSTNSQNSVANLFGMDANGNFQNISTANLASVLGAATPKGLYYNTDLNTLTTPGCYRISTGCTNTPTANAEGQLNVHDSTDGVITQQFIEHPSLVYERMYWYGDWTAWRRLDNFNCNTPEALASLLGALPIAKAADMDANTLGNGTIYATTGWQNVPFRYCFIQTMVAVDSPDKVQIATSVTTGVQQRRGYDGNTWTQWA